MVGLVRFELTERFFLTLFKTELRKVSVAASTQKRTHVFRPIEIYILAVSMTDEFIGSITPRFSVSEAIPL